MRPDEDEVITWLLDSDPALRWQTMRDLLGAPEEQWRAERARVATEGWGAELLAHQDDDGQWAGGAFAPADVDAREWREVGQPWTATSFVLQELRELGVDPRSERVRRAVGRVGEVSVWDHAGEPFWAGEVEECINGRLVGDGAYFGVDVSTVVDRLLGEVMDDGGWNCERERGSTRSSFHSTVNVLEGLAEHERATGGAAASRAARRSGEDYLLRRGLMRRLGTGEVVEEEFLHFLHPSRWRYDVLRALDHLRAVADLDGTGPDPRVREAVEHVRSRRRDDGTWVLDRVLPGRAWLDYGERVGEPSRWVTLKALRVLRWAQPHD